MQDKIVFALQEDTAKNQITSFHSPIAERTSEDREN